MIKMKNCIIPLYPSSYKLLEKPLGCYQYDSDGREYIDFEFGVWYANLVHSNEKPARVHPKNIGMIGLPLFMKFKIIFDYIINKLYIEPNSNFDGSITKSNE